MVEPEATPAREVEPHALGERSGESRGGDDRDRGEGHDSGERGGRAEQGRSDRPGRDADAGDRAGVSGGATGEREEREGAPPVEAPDLGSEGIGEGRGESGGERHGPDAEQEEGRSDAD